MTSERTDVARRSSGGSGAVLGFLLLLGLVIQVVKLLVIPLTILAIGAVVVPIYMITKSRRDPAVPLPAAEPKAIPEDDGIVSQEAILKLLPTEVAADFTYRDPHEAPPNPPAPSRPSPGSGDGIRATGYRHGSCPVRHRTYEAAARCRNR